VKFYEFPSNLAQQICPTNPFIQQIQTLSANAASRAAQKSKKDGDREKSRIATALKT
jgi:hypothetical protein